MGAIEELEVGRLMLGKQVEGTTINSYADTQLALVRWTALYAHRTRVN